MSHLINVYCDESCHLEHDGHSAMVLGAVWCPEAKKKEISQRIGEIRARHNMPRSFEFKWSKVSISKLQMYMDIIDYFFDDDDLNFRCIVIPDKSIIDHETFKQTHNDWYYKIYFTMLKVILRPTDQYHIYLDIKDTNSKYKVKKLHEVLCTSAYDFSRNVIKRVQQIRSHELAQSQVADLLIGAMSYKHRHLKDNKAKLLIIDRIIKRSGYSLERSTLLKEEKFNIFIWRGGDQ